MRQELIAKHSWREGEKDFVTEIYSNFLTMAREYVSVNGMINR